MNKARAAEVLTTADIHPVTLDRILLNYFPDWILWEPETLVSGIRSLTAQGGVQPLILHKAAAVQTVHNNEGPWEDWEVFNWVNQPFNDELTNFVYAKKPSLPELMVTVTTINHLRQREFGEEVIDYMVAACLDAGLVYVTDPLTFIQPTLNMVEYRCTVCGNIDKDDTNHMCDYCHAPESALVKYPKYYDWAEIKERWDAIKDTSLSQLRLEETVVDVNVGKLIKATVLLAEREDQLEAELAYVQD